MESEEAFIVHDGIVVPDSTPRAVERGMVYGSVPGLDDEELAGPAELLRQVMIAEWGPILAIPITWEHPVIRPNIDENGELDWGPFATVDFDRLRPPFNKALYKANKLQEDLRNALIMLSIVQERLSVDDRLEVLELVRSECVDLDDFSDENRRAYARWYMRARRLRREIRELREFSRRGWQRGAASRQRPPSCCAGGWGVAVSGAVYLSVTIDVGKARPCLFNEV